ncbi:hypothetical protein C1141_15465 [Vibrio agarivorans]|nr:hypothetical protein C1141_15465 [Vibrio agarivorans]
MGIFQLFSAFLVLSFMHVLEIPLEVQILSTPIRRLRMILKLMSMTPNKVVLTPIAVMVAPIVEAVIAVEVETVAVAISFSSVK